MMTINRKRIPEMKTLSIDNAITCIIIGYIFPLQTTSTPFEIAQLVGRNVSLKCPKSSSDGIIWRFNEVNIFDNERLFRGVQFKGRSRFENDSATGKEILKISDLKREDAGLYRCLDATTEIPLQSTQLTVLDSEPTCHSNIKNSGFVGPKACGNTYGLNGDDMRFSCAVSYYGAAPRLQWETVNGNQIFKDCTSDKKQTAKWRYCNLTLKAEPKYDGSYLRCSVLTSHGEQYNCSTEAIKVLYFTPEENYLKPRYKAIGDEISCSAESNLKLNFSWIREVTNKEDVVGTNRSYVIEKEGLYYCNVSYSIKDASCWAMVSVVHTHHTEPNVCLFGLVNIMVPLVFAVVSYFFIEYREIKDALTELKINGWSILVLFIYAVFDIALSLFDVARPDGNLLNVKYAMAFILLLFTFFEVSFLLILKWMGTETSSFKKAILIFFVAICIAFAASVIVLMNPNSLRISYGWTVILSIIYVNGLIIFACVSLTVFIIKLCCEVSSLVMKVILHVFGIFCFLLGVAAIFTESFFRTNNVAVFVWSASVCGILVVFKILELYRSSSERSLRSVRARDSVAT